MSVFDDGADLAPPATETRGGEHPDWARAMPGKELPELSPGDVLHLHAEGVFSEGTLDDLPGNPGITNLDDT